ncbi:MULTISPECIES: hypothetical protein [unclassified Psychrobacter]|uniref:hypothetical protein n=1 Tax=unclassified Psychrobacter TaxID=196806 RepID=UPI003FD137F2
MVAVPSTIIKSGLIAAVSAVILGGAVGCTVTSGYDNQPIYRDNSVNRASQQLRQDLRRSGYTVMDIKRDNYRGRQVLVAYAKKNNQFYDFIYSYPDLKRLSVNKRDVKDNWKNDKNKSDNNRYKNKNKNKGKKYKNNKDDRLQQEARYPAIKQRAIRKVRAMGYRVTDIDFESKKNRGVFEIEARRGGQDYEIELSYPNLDVIKLKKD